ncbi:oxidoreductase-like protein [Xylaria cf. heliscus]|nr:oxidoreductase-like protein [Xylaria cf. heliscus]
MPPNMRPLMRVARIQSTLPRNPQIQRSFASGPLPGGTPGESSVQALPIGPYYEAILTKPQPIPEAKPEQPPTSSPKSPRPPVKKPSKAKETSSSSSSGTTTAATTTAAATTSTSTSTSTPTSASTSASTSTSTSTSTINTVPPQPTSEPASAQDKARIIFGSRLAGPAERADRLQSIRDRSVLVAGVLVPPRPEEPDNCCMSGCVNCVWDRYGEELENWAAASARADEALQAERARGGRAPVDVDAVEGDTSVSAAVSSVDDDGGGSETNWHAEKEMAKKTDRPKIAKDLWDDELYSNVPVGIREFMKHEKKLKRKHEEEGTLGG